VAARNRFQRSMRRQHICLVKPTGDGNREAIKQLDRPYQYKMLNFVLHRATATMARQEKQIICLTFLNAIEGRHLDGYTRPMAVAAEIDNMFSKDI
jgi:hypothetical protein